MDVYHGEAECHVKFSDIVPECKAFLAQNPSETIVMMISRNRLVAEQAYEAAARVVKQSEERFAQDVDLLTADPVFLKQTDIPTLAQAKGRIVLMTRCPGGPGIPWQSGQPDNSEADVTEAGNRFHIQDLYDPEAGSSGKLNTKWSVIKANLINAPLKGRQQGIWWINYTSASQFLDLDPVDFALGARGEAGMNSRLADYLKKHPKGYYGTIPMDFPDDELIQRLIGTNR